MDTVTRVQTLNDTVCISHRANTLVKGMHPTIPSLAMGKLSRKLVSWTREENILRHYLLGDKIIQNGFKIVVTYSYDYDLLLRQETQKKIARPGSLYNNLKKLI